ncbi:hypothetical protein IQ265_27775 [Nodosilinea sp. LEGE 06152]|uniref:hypothetical protein n=1 Tax=Nodosilinea sp. LEGE 06152 TaxID=2777966 RepID=UPI0018806688|nr:hypothetical protein [Nodosilinea sp. LEGE 06152]MBE9160591.1 hypothetical protein [Nodosilinea sp. LEGE 06152]
MQVRRALKLSLGFGLPMVLMGAVFWAGSGWLTGRVLGQSDFDVAQIDTTGAEAVSVAFAVRVLSIDAEIDRNSQVTEVTVQTGGSSLQEMEFEYPLADYAEVENAIAEDLSITSEQVRRLIRYRIN